MKMKKGRKLISLLLLLTVMVSTSATSVHANDVSRLGQGRVGYVRQAYTGGRSQVYAHLITKADGTEVRYVYSKNYPNVADIDALEDSFAALKSVLTADYAALIPDKVDESRNGKFGFFFCSDPSLEEYVNDNWTSAEYVARNFLTVKKEGKSYTYKCEGEGAGGAVNTSATAARQNNSNRFELIKTLAEKANKAKWEAYEEQMKAAWDAAEAEKQENNPDYIPQEYQRSTYVELDFGELTGDDIQGKRDLTDSQIDLAVRCNLQTTYEFEGGKLIEVANIEIIDHVTNIYSEHAIISESSTDAGDSTDNTGSSSENVSSDDDSSSKGNIALTPEQIGILNAVFSTVDKTQYKLYKEVQGPLCREVFRKYLQDGWKELYSVSIIEKNNHEIKFTVRHGLKKFNMVITIPENDRKAGRRFAIIAVDKEGNPHIYYDTDTSDSTITVDVDFVGYAFDIIYKD